MVNPTPTAQSTFLVSGGGKGITARCVVELARRYHSHFVLLGRSEILEPEPTWAAGCEAEPMLKKAALTALQAAGERPTPREVGRRVRRLQSSREIQATLDAVAEAGGTAEYVSADVTDADGLTAALAPWQDKVTGVIHGAGVLADRWIEEKTEADFETVVGVKVDGLRALLDCVPVDQLEHLVLFSSVAAFYGNAGQADYALANEVFNKIAHHIHQTHPNCRVLAVDWGPWDGGMVSPQLKRILERRNIDVIPVEVGTSMLADELARADGVPQVVVGSAMPAPSPSVGEELRTYEIRRHLTLADNPFLKDHVIGGRAVLPTVCAVAWMTDACEQRYPGYTFFSVEGYKVFKGVVFDETLADDYVLRLEEIAKTSEEVVFDTLIYSETPEGRPRYHYGARVTLVRELPDAPCYADFDPTERDVVPGTQLYDEKTLFHGPSFCGVEQIVNVSERRLTQRCRLPALDPTAQGQFPVQTFNPYLTDVHLQSLLIWAQRHQGVVGLPLCITKAEQFRKAHFDQVTYATLEVQESGKHRLVADVTITDAEGRLFSRVTGAEITLSARLNELFLQNELVEEQVYG
jgi:NAD(P)-dependent dehydrogenase (short-subunit alcohol dehydrogenase family)